MIASRANIRPLVKQLDAVFFSIFFIFILEVGSTLLEGGEERADGVE